MLFSSFLRFVPLLTIRPQIGCCSNNSGLDDEFFKLCLETTSKKLDNQSPFTTDPTRRLTDHYPDAFTNFCGTPSNASCIFKTGPVWPKTEGPDTQPYKRELRTVAGGHPIVDKCPEIRKDIRDHLVSRGIQASFIDSVAFANAGHKIAFCPLRGRQGRR